MSKLILSHHLRLLPDLPPSTKNLRETIRYHYKESLHRKGTDVEGEILSEQVCYGRQFNPHQKVSLIFTIGQKKARKRDTFPSSCLIKGS